MKINYLNSIFKSFQKSDFEQFRAFLSSEFINSNPHFISFFDHISSKIESNEALILDKNKAFQILHPMREFNDLRLRHSISEFRQLVDNYLVFQHFKKNQSLKNSILLQSLRNKNLRSNFKKTLNKINPEKKTYEVQSMVDPLFEKYLLQKEVYEFEHSLVRIKEDKITPLVQTLDQFYLLENIKLALYDWVNYKESENKLFFKNKIRELIKRTNYLTTENTKIFSLYIQMYELLYADSEVPFGNVIEQFFNIELKINIQERKYIYLILINYCAQFINKGNRDYAYQGLSLYLRGLNNKILLTENILSPFTYKNIVFIYLTLKDFDHAREFMNKYTKNLPYDNRENSYHYNLATTYFIEGDYNNALEIMSKTKFIDVYDDLGARRMLVRIYYEREEWSALNSCLDALEIHLKRKKKLGSHQELFGYLVKYTRKSIALHTNETKKIKTLIDEISSKPAFPEKPWLIKRLRDRLNKP